MISFSAKSSRTLGSCLVVAAGMALGSAGCATTTNSAANVSQNRSIVATIYLSNLTGSPATLTDGWHIDTSPGNGPRGIWVDPDGNPTNGGQPPSQINTIAPGASQPVSFKMNMDDLASIGKGVNINLYELPFQSGSKIDTVTLVLRTHEPLTMSVDRRASVQATVSTSAGVAAPATVATFDGDDVDMTNGGGPYQMGVNETVLLN